MQIMGIPDAALRQQLGELFAAMHLAKASQVCSRCACCLDLSTAHQCTLQVTPEAVPIMSI